MLLFEPPPSKFDLHFRVASIPVRVHPLFWVTTVIMAINGRDFPVVQAAVFVVAVSFVLINLIVDLAYTWLDPRVRLS